MMSEKQTYEVIYTVEHNGALYKKGSEISLSDGRGRGPDCLRCDTRIPKASSQARSESQQRSPASEQEVASAQPAVASSQAKKKQ